MTPQRPRKVETRFARRAVLGSGIGIEEAVAAAEARIETLRASGCEAIGIALGRMQAARSEVAKGEPLAFALINAQADVLVGLGAPFGLVEIGAAASSLCKLFDVRAPDWPSAAEIGVHLDALALFWACEPSMRAASAHEVLEGLHRVTAAAHRHAPSGHAGRADR